MKTRPVSLFCCVGLLVGCSETMLTVPMEPEAPPRQSVEAHSETYELTGRVATIHGAPIVDVEVVIGSRVRVTDEHGVFTARLPRAETVQVFARKDGWTEGHQRLLPTDLGEVAVEVALLPTRSMYLASAAEGGRVEGDLGVALEFPPNAFVDLLGRHHAGAVEVEYALLETARAIRAAPGGMTARLDDGETALESFGMVEVEFVDNGGNPLEFIGESARLEIPATDTHDFEDGDPVLMWTFDEESGVWLREGGGRYEDGKIVARVPHFSWWNCDRPLQSTCIVGTLGGDLVSTDQLSFTARTTGVDYRGTDIRTAEEDGGFCVAAMRGGTFDLEITAHIHRRAISLGIVPGLRGDDVVADCGTPTLCADIGVVVLAPLTDADRDGEPRELGDCADDDPAAGTWAEEVCNGRDDDCDGGVDEHAPDLDRDGFNQCSDCDDANPTTHPGAAASCDGSPDNDCDGQVDTIHLDADGDGLTRCDGDCDDGDAGVLRQCSFGLLALSGAQGCALRADGPVCWGANAVQVPGSASEVQGIGAGHTTTCGVTIGAGVQCWGMADLALPDEAVLGEYDDVVVGETHACALAPGGAVACWGSAADGRLEAPPGSVFVDIAVASDFTCGAVETGEVTCWGDTPAGVHIPAGLDAVALDVSDRSGCAVNSEGRVRCWGAMPQVPADGQSLVFSSVAVGADHACAQMEDGRLYCWGDNRQGQTDAPPYIFAGYSAWGDTTCGLRPNDQIACWGPNVNGTAAPPQ